MSWLNIGEIERAGFELKRLGKELEHGERLFKDVGRVERHLKDVERDVKEIEGLGKDIDRLDRKGGGSSGVPLPGRGVVAGLAVAGLAQPPAQQQPPKPLQVNLGSGGPGSLDSVLRAFLG